MGTLCSDKFCKFYHDDCRLSKNCLREEENDFQIPETDIFLDLYPGQIYDPDDQCRIANGLESRYEGVRKI